MVVGPIIFHLLQSSLAHGTIILTIHSLTPQVHYFASMVLSSINLQILLFSWLICLDCIEYSPLYCGIPCGTYGLRKALTTKHLIYSHHSKASCPTVPTFPHKTKTFNMLYCCLQLPKTATNMCHHNEH